jgi:hypothetical protein
LTDFNKKISKLTEKIGLDIDIDKSINELSALKEKPIIQKTAAVSKSVRDYVSENLTVFIGGFVCIIIVLIIAVFAAINFADVKTRVVSIVEISGEVTLLRDTKTHPANKNTKLSSGELITLGKNARVRIKLDPDKYLTVLEDTSLSVDFSNIEGSGSITVNLLYGNIITEMSKELGKADTFTILTPNASVSVRKAVFTTAFRYYDDYGGKPAKITDIADYSGNLTLQLYNDSGEKADNPMIQAEKTTAKLITTPDEAVYGSLNYELSLAAVSSNTLIEILRISNGQTLAYPTIELNDALRIAAERNYTTVSAVTPPETVTTTPFEPIILPPVTTPPEVTADYLDDITDSEITTATTPQTVPTTQTVGELTTYTGEKWWEIQRTEARGQRTE